jgi:hypothetical protein
MITVGNLQLADTVNLGFGPWGNAVVTQIKNGTITLSRPYVHTADFSYTGGVIPYIGMETLTFNQSSTTKYELLERKSLR